MISKSSVGENWTNGARVRAMICRGSHQPYEMVIVRWCVRYSIEAAFDSDGFVLCRGRLVVSRALLPPRDFLELVVVSPLGMVEYL